MWHLLVCFSFPCNSQPSLLIHSLWVCFLPTHRTHTSTEKTIFLVPFEKACCFTSATLARLWANAQGPANGSKLRKILESYEVLWYLWWSTGRTGTKALLQVLIRVGITIRKHICHTTESVPYKWCHTSWQLVWLNIKNYGTEMRPDN